LHVTGTGWDKGAVGSLTGNYLSSGTILSKNSSGTEVGGLTFGALNGVVNSNYGVISTAYSGDGLVFNTRVSGTETPRLLITNGGNVGIGTASPNSNALLHVKGATAGSTYAPIFEHGDNTNSGSHMRLSVATGGSSGGDPFLLLDIAGTPGWHVGVDNADSDKLKIGRGGNNPGDAANTEMVTVDTSGNVGIGTTNPTAILEVACPSGFTNVKAAGNQLGCMETAEHGTGTFWTAANTCFTTYGGRLPIYSEWYITMNNYALTDEIDDWEWQGHGDYYSQRACALAGSGSIDVADTAGCNSTYAYRCWIPR
jgi:hypothetical protein